MTPKEKANELVNKFRPYTNVKESKKKCALIAVSELSKQLDEVIDMENVTFWFGEKAGETIDGIELQDYWNEVQKEIEAL